MSTQRPPLSIEQQAEFIDYIANRCKRSDGTIAGEAFILIDKSEAEDLRHLATRLRRMAPYEDRIRRIVVGR